MNQDEERLVRGGMAGVVSVLIVNYATPELTVQAAQSALAEPLVHEAVIVNNPSDTDAANGPADTGAVSVSALRRYESQEARVRFVELEANRGFGAGVNAAANVASAPFVFALNSDAILQAGALGRLVDIMESEVQIGLAAPPVYLADGVTLQPDACGSFPTPLRLLTRATTAACESESPDWVSGVAFLVRRSEFLELGGFDEKIFMYYEDVDLCRRYRTTLGKVCRRLTSGAGVIHLGGASRRSKRKQKADQHAAQDYYLRKVGFSRASRLVVRATRSLYVRFGHGRADRS